MPSIQIAYQQVIIEPMKVVGSTSITPPHNTQYEALQNAELVYQTFPELVMLSPDWIYYPKKHPKSIDIQKGQDSPLITRKELRKKVRELRRWKKKAARERMASEFMKGDIPYVVPVNPNNF